MSRIRIDKGYVPGSLGRAVELHGAYYGAHWGFGLFFEAKVATDLAEFLKRCDESRDGFWTASADGRVEGCIAIDGIHAETGAPICDGSSCPMPSAEKAQAASFWRGPWGSARTGDTRGSTCGPSRGWRQPGISTKSTASGSLRNSGDPDGAAWSMNNASSACWPPWPDPCPCSMIFLFIPSVGSCRQATVWSGSAAGRAGPHDTPAPSRLPPAQRLNSRRPAD